MRHDIQVECTFETCTLLLLKNTGYHETEAKASTDFFASITREAAAHSSFILRTRVSANLCSKGLASCVVVQKHMKNRSALGSSLTEYFRCLLLYFCPACFVGISWLRSFPFPSAVACRSTASSSSKDNERKKGSCDSRYGGTLDTELPSAKAQLLIANFIMGNIVGMMQQMVANLEAVQ